MNISELLHENTVEIGAELYSKDEALDLLIGMQKDSGSIRDTRALRREIYEREREGSSAVSGRVALPCVSPGGAVRSSLSAVTIKNGVEYHAPDKRPVRLIFLITGRSGSAEHRIIKERLQKLLSDPAFSAKLYSAKSKRQFINLIADKERVQLSFDP